MQGFVSVYAARNSGQHVKHNKVDGMPECLSLITRLSSRPFQVCFYIQGGGAVKVHVALNLMLFHAPRLLTTLKLPVQYYRAIGCIMSLVARQLPIPFH